MHRVSRASPTDDFGRAAGPTIVFSDRDGWNAGTSQSVSNAGNDPPARSMRFWEVTSRDDCASRDDTAGRDAGICSRAARADGASAGATKRVDSRADRDAICEIDSRALDTGGCDGIWYAGRAIE